MKLSRKVNVWSIARQEFGLKGNKRRLYAQFMERHGWEPKRELL